MANEESTDGELLELGRRVYESYDNYTEALERYDAAVGKGTVVVDATGQRVEFPPAVSGSQPHRNELLRREKDAAWQKLVADLRDVAAKVR